MRAVAPLAGAWIETIPSGSMSGSALVAPLAGAWIETPIGSNYPGCCCVAPLAGAWIETSSILRSRGLFVSHPLRVRGLKRGNRKAY